MATDMEFTTTDEENGDEDYAAIEVLSDFALQASFSRDIEGIIGKVVTSLPPSEQLGALSERLAVYLDDNQTAALALLFGCSLDPEVRALVAESVERVAPDRHHALRDTMRRLQGLFGSEISAAISAVDVDPANWSNLDTRISYLPLAEEFRLELEITRFDRSKFSINGPPTSFLRLVNYLLRQLTAMPAEAHVFEEELPAFVEAYEEFVSQYSAAELEGTYSEE